MGRPTGSLCHSPPPGPGPVRPPRRRDRGAGTQVGVSPGVVGLTKGATSLGPLLPRSHFMGCGLAQFRSAAMSVGSPPDGCSVPRQRLAAEPAEDEVAGRRPVEEALRVFSEPAGVPPAPWLARTHETGRRRPKPATFSHRSRGMEHFWLQHLSP